jgi:hypothetical protein
VPTVDNEDRIQQTNIVAPTTKPKAVNAKLHRIAGRWAMTERWRRFPWVRNRPKMAPGEKSSRISINVPLNDEPADNG